MDAGEDEVRFITHIRYVDEERAASGVARTEGLRR
jgi:hypothetical protein